MMKLKHNSNAWQDVGNVDNDESFCGLYCVAFLHNLLNLHEPYYLASEFQK